MKLSAADLSGLGRDLRAIVRLQPGMSAAAQVAVAHYLEHGEFEMAYESLMLSVLDERVPLDLATKTALRDIGLALGLDAESVFRADFWGLMEPLWSSLPPLRSAPAPRGSG